MAKTSFLNGPGIKDIVESLKRIRIALYLAWSDTKARYKRSVLGPLWLTLGTAVGVAGLGWLWSELLDVDRTTFIPSLTAGLIIWQILASSLTESAPTFVRQSNVIRNLKLPYFLHPLQLVLRQFINFAHNIVVFVVVAILLQVPVTKETLMVIPGIALLFLNLTWITLIIAIFGARFRDIEYLLASLVPLLFFVSPVLYRPSYLKISATIIWLNPLTHLIEVVRSPLLGVLPPWYVYAACIGMLVVGWAVTIAVFNTRCHRIAYWV